MVPGVKPPIGIESDEMRGAIRAAAAAGLGAFAVGICEAICSIGCPQDAQNRLAACTSAEHFGQWTLPGFTAADYRPLAGSGGGILLIHSKWDQQGSNL